MPEFLVTHFGALLLVAVAALPVSHLAFQSSAPLRRSASTAAAAWAICSIVAGLVSAEWRGFDIGASVYFVPGALVVGVLLWRSYREGWQDEEPVPDAPFEEQQLWARSPDEEPAWVGHQYAVDPALEWEPDRSGNYVVRHWRGELSLPVSYWLNGGLIGGGALFALALAVRAIEDAGGSLRTIAFAALGLLAASLLLWVWSAVGIWRSSNYHEERGGTAAWGYIAKIMVVIGILGTFGQLKSYTLQGLEYGALAAGGDPIGAPAEISLAEDGKSVAVNGNITSGTAARFVSVIDAAPALETVVLTSPGGRMLEGTRMAEAIARRRLDTRVEGECMSACTFVLLAGRDRSASPEAAIGFHQPSFPGVSPAEMRASVEGARADYRRAGVAADFADRAMATSPDSVWVPDHDELLAANVLTTTDTLVSAPTPASAAAERRAVERDLSLVARRLNARGRLRVDALTTFESAAASGAVLTYRYRLGLDRRRVDVAALRAAVRSDVEANICEDPDMEEMTRRGGRFVYDYRDRAGRRLFDVSVGRCDDA
jgi:hypothetical protein